jgi:hypothetical protein
MANGAVLYTTAPRTSCKGEVHRGGCGRDAPTPFPHRNDRVTARRAGSRCAAHAADDRAEVRVRGRAARNPAGRYGSRTEGWMSVPVPAS